MRYPGLVLLLLLAGCAMSSDAGPDRALATSSPTIAIDSGSKRATAVPNPANGPNQASPDPDNYAQVIGVTVSGNPGAYIFAVTIQSPDTGCDQYADWWEALTSDGELIHRRVLLHSHTGEQPFTRSGRPVNIQPDETIIFRGHMSANGYGSSAYQGSVATGFTPTNLPDDFARDVAAQGPLPTGCAF